MAEVARAGKDAYCEKPMANTLADARLWLSCPYQQRVREIVEQPPVRYAPEGRG